MSPRTRVRVVVASIALVAAAVAVGATLLQSGDESEGESGEPPALELGIALRDDPNARALRAAERAYERGEREAARERFEAVLRRDPSSLEAAVGAAIAAWPNGTLSSLRDLAERHPASGVVRLHLGLVLFAQGERDEAAKQWREAERRDPDTPAAVRAEDLLHPGMAPGRPFFFPTSFPQLRAGLSGNEQLELLRKRAEGGSAENWLHYGVALQRAGRPVSARAAYERALALDPGDLQARVADAVARFDKDDPAQAFSRLGPLSRDHPRAGIVRFHLGLLLLWLRAVDEARDQLELAIEGDPGGFYGREAEDLLVRLGN